MDDFIQYSCSLGTVTAHEGGSYIIATSDGRTIGIPATGEPSPEAIESDITAAAQPPHATPAQIAAHRYDVENGGVIVPITTAGTHTFDTSRENRAMWLAVQLQAQANPAFAQGWKTLEGGFVMLTNADVLAVCSAVYSHVADCFGAEAALQAAPPLLADLEDAFAAAL